MFRFSHWIPNSLNKKLNQSLENKPSKTRGSKLLKYTLVILWHKASFTFQQLTHTACAPSTIEGTDQVLCLQKGGKGQPWILAQRCCPGASPFPQGITQSLQQNLLLPWIRPPRKDKWGFSFILCIAKIRQGSPKLTVAPEANQVLLSTSASTLFPHTHHRKSRTVI